MVVIVMGFMFWKDVKTIVGSRNSSSSVQDFKKIKKSKDAPVDNIEIREKWDLPEVLKEVSGISYLDENRFAAVQDEEGKIFIYNRKDDRIEREINFAGPGDYEGITTKGNTAWVVRADGTLFEVDMNSGKNTKQYKTHLTVEHNVEGLTYDIYNERLLLGIKDNEPGNKEYKGIYPFDLNSKTLSTVPAYRIDLTHELFGTRKKKGTIMPSAIAIHPTTKEIFVTDGPNSRLLIMDPKGNPQRLLQLGKNFSQPEGITFSPMGELFISNEGSKQPGNIILINY